MTHVWDSEAYSGGTLLVLLALADFAGDDGKRIYPHVETLAKKARLSIRSTQLALETLRADGVIRPVANAGGGRGKSVEYEMDVERVQKMRPDEKGAISDEKGCNSRHKRVQKTTERVQNSTAHIEEPSEPSKEPSEESPARPNGPAPEPAQAGQSTLFEGKPDSRDVIAIPTWIPVDAWRGYIEMRKRKRAPPTKRALELVVKALDNLRRGGMDPGAVLDQSTRNSWTDVYPLKDQQQGGLQYGSTSSPAGNSRGGSSPGRLDRITQAATAAIAAGNRSQ